MEKELNGMEWNGMGGEGRERVKSPQNCMVSYTPRIALFGLYTTDLFTQNIPLF